MYVKKSMKKIWNYFIYILDNVYYYPMIHLIFLISVFLKDAEKMVDFTDIMTLKYGK